MNKQDLSSYYIDCGDKNEWNSSNTVELGRVWCKV